MSCYLYLGEVKKSQEDEDVYIGLQGVGIPEQPVMHQEAVPLVVASKTILTVVCLVLLKDS